MQFQLTLRIMFLSILVHTLPYGTIAAAQTTPPLRPPYNAASPEDESRAQMEKDMAKKANEQRHTQLKRDTENLLKLATELKEDVDKSNEHTLSLDVIRKAELVEKLARSVKEKMRGYN